MKQPKQYIVDSDILIDALRKIPGAAEYMDSLGDWSYSIASAMELFSGARNKKEIRDIETVLKRRLGVSGSVPFMSRI